MIDWVMPPQTAVALYIYRVGRSCPAKNPFTTRNSQGLLNSTRTRGPPVRPVRPTGQTGVAVAGSATRRPTGQTVKGHRSGRWRQPDRPCAKFGCEHMPPCFFSKACCLKNNSKVDVTLHRPFFWSKGDFYFKSAISYQASCQTLR
jgi:hypothetical protein